uniref:Protein kinase domain-containing protein n=1 Tax=Timema tahoe TaxID=61484 RepID=A0A7R9IJ78_9NEOP|nr:unnamed protein product [Timema tahoe]
MPQMFVKSGKEFVNRSKGGTSSSAGSEQKRATNTESNMLTERGPGRPKLLRTGRRGRPTKIYQSGANPANQDIALSDDPPDVRFLELFNVNEFIDIWICFGRSKKNLMYVEPNLQQYLKARSLDVGYWHEGRHFQKMENSWLNGSPTPFPATTNGHYNEAEAHHGVYLSIPLQVCRLKGLRMPPVARLPWSLGCILYAMCYFKSPFDSVYECGDSVALAVISGNVKFPENSPYDQEMHNLIMYMLKVNPMERPYIYSVIEKTHDVMLKLQAQGLHDSKSLPSPGLQESKSLPLKGLQESKSLPFKGLQESKSLPFKGLQESKTLPSRSLQESKSLPSKSHQENQNLPFMGLRESKSLSSKGHQEDKRLLSKGL